MAMSTPTYTLALLALVGFSASAGSNVAYSIAEECNNKAFTKSESVDLDKINADAKTCLAKNGLVAYARNGFKLNL